MKKLTAIVMTLVLALLCCVSVMASAGSTPTFVWEDCAIQLLSYKIVKIAYSSAHMDLYARVLNNKDYKISVWLENADIDGVEVTVGPIVLIDPHSDTGTEDPVSFYVFAPSANKEAASDAIVNARTLSGTLELRNDETNEVMLRQKLSIELDVLDGVRNVPTPKPTNTPKPTPKPTPVPTAAPAPDDNDYGNNPPPYNPASWNFTGLKEGSSGQAVKDLQQRLWDLGYYRDKINGEYGLSTTIAVRSFCDQNKLPVGNNVTPEMQTLLYSSGAEYYEEPYLTLVIGPHANWENSLSGTDVGFLYPQVVNRGNRDIRGFELYFYLTDVWGDIIYVEQNGTRAYLAPRTIAQTIESGYCEYLEYACGLPIYPFAYTYTVYVGVHKIVYADGEIREIPVEDIDYFSIRIKN